LLKRIPLYIKALVSGATINKHIFPLCLQASSLSYLFAGIPIFNALRFIITINSIINNEEMAPTKKIALNAISFGTVVVPPFSAGTSATYRLINTPAITGPIAPPIILIVLKVAETTPVDSRGVKYIITFADNVAKAPPTQQE
jgi:hypothetical protein